MCSPLMQTSRPLKPSQWPPPFYAPIIPHQPTPRQDAGLSKRIRAAGSAVRYLKTLADRDPEDVATHLNNAAAQYEEVLAALRKADTSGEALSSPAGREALAKLAEQVAGLESQAIQEIEKAVAAAS